jgi:hypothetical protein
MAAPLVADALLDVDCSGFCARAHPLGAPAEQLIQEVDSAAASSCCSRCSRRA